MAKVCILLASTVVSWAFWWIADKLGCDFFTAFLISGVGALLGCWPGWLIYKRFFS